MEVVFGLVGVSVVLVIVIALVLLWAVRSGQFEDLEGPAWRVLMDDDRAAPPAAGEGEGEGDASDDAPGAGPARRRDRH